MVRVLLTGANGSIGRYLVPHLRNTCELRIAVGSPPRPGMEPLPTLPGDDLRQIDLQDRASVLSAMDGVEAVVHLAGQREFKSTWDELLGPNVEGLYNLFEVASEVGVRKVVFASSNHVIGGYDLRGLWPVSTDAPVWPDSLYGATKAFGEALGRYFAYEAGMSVICIRIGWVLDQPHNEMALRMWLSPNDLRRLIDCSLQATVQFGIYFGVSANTRCKYEMLPARRDLGYVPEDDSEVFAAAVLGATTPTVAPAGSDEPGEQ